MQKFTRNIDNMPISELTLNYFVENESKFHKIEYVIKYIDFLKKEPSPGRDWVVYDGNKATFNHIIRNRQYFGNTKMIRVKKIKGKGFNRIIRVNKTYLFSGAILFVKADGKIYQLKYDEGFLQIFIGARKTVNHFQIRKKS